MSVSAKPSTALHWVGSKRSDTCRSAMTAKIGGMPLPAVEEVLQDAAVVVLPMRVKFRGIRSREAVLLRGPQGWAEFAPFVEYDDSEASRWLAAAVAAGWRPHVPAVRDLVPVNATVPAVP